MRIHIMATFIGMALSAAAVVPMFNGYKVGASKTTFNLKDAYVVATDQAGASVAELFPLHGKNCQILLESDTTISSPEGYKLEIEERDAKITAASPAGWYYGLQTLRQLTPDSCMVIEDSPRFAYRGMHLDPCRHFLPIDVLKRQIDVMGTLKLNRLHLHLTDDQGWRMEIKRYPELTRVGSVRTEGDGSSYGGYYTQDELRDLVDYAQKRNIVIVPEIELPGHGMAAIAAYPWLSCRGEQGSPRIIWGVEDVVMCPGKESTFEFLQNVMDEVMQVFPSEYIHIGGDECPKVEWEKCPLCQKRIEQKNLKDVEGLQAYVVKRMEDYLATHGRKIIGWDEILEGGGSPKATIMSWRGIEGGIEAARTGRDAIMTPGEYMYMDKYQGDYRLEPTSIGGLLTLEKAYSYEPVPEALKNDSLGHHVLGVQGNNWSEYHYTPEIMELRAYPRMLAVAEIGWTNPELKDYKNFEQRVDAFLPRLDEMGVNYFIPRPEMPGGTLKHMEFTDTAHLTLATTRPMEIYYQWEDDSVAYVNPIEINHSGTLKAWSQLPSGKQSPVTTIELKKAAYVPGTGVPVSAETPKLTQMMMTLVEGEFLKRDEAFEEAPRLPAVMVDTTYELRNHPGYSAVIDGFVSIPEDGIYRFKTLNEELWVDGEKIIDNSGEVKHYTHTEVTKTLGRGLHPVKIVFLRHIIGGWPSWWNTGEVFITKEP